MQYYTIRVNGVIRPLNLALYVDTFDPTTDANMLMGEMRLCGIEFSELGRLYYDVLTSARWGDIDKDTAYAKMIDLHRAMRERINSHLPDAYYFGCGGINSIGGNKVGYWRWPNESLA